MSLEYVDRPWPVAGAAALLLPLLLSACVASPDGPVAMATRPLPERDGAGLAAWIGEVCDKNPHTRAECREAAVVRLAEERGIGVAMDVVAHLEASDAEGHGLTHMIGIRGYLGAATMRESFEACTAIHQSGCYHGVVQAYFSELRQDHGMGALTTERLDAVCGPYAGPDGDPWLRFQCLHGMGHGVMLVHDNHLPRALLACDLLSDGWEREVCYGGAFMENVMGVLAPHHAHVGEPMAGAHPHDAAHGATQADPEAAAEHSHHHPDPADHAAHTAPSGSAGEAFPPIDPDDLQYPCSALDDRYRMACYDMQTATMLHLLDRDFAATAAACRAAPDPILRSVCHRSLGRDINAETDGRHAESAALCALAAPQDRSACHTGVVKNVIDVTADASSGLAYCALVPVGDESRACYRAIGEQTPFLMADPADRQRFCDSLDGGHRTVCLEGAGAYAGVR
jgi:hypothetical protein